MSELPEEARIEMALREGLRSLPVPDTSPDFAARIHAALRRPVPWWQMLWVHARPVLGAGACSLIGMLALLHWTAQMPLTPPATTLQRTDTTALNRVLESPSLATASLDGLSSLRRLSRANTPESNSLPRIEIPKKPAPERHSQNPVCIPLKEKRSWRRRNATGSGWWDSRLES